MKAIRPARLMLQFSLIALLTVGVAQAKPPVQPDSDRSSVGKPIPPLTTRPSTLAETFRSYAGSD